MSTEIDHVVVGAASLEEGRRWCVATLGVTPSPGGQHALMGTHNLLAQISGPTFARCYLEIIAIDPSAPHPGRPRWFGLDAPAQAQPHLAQLVVRSRMLETHRRELMQQGVDPGDPVALARGDLRWSMLLHTSARMPGALPMLIQWDEPHPADRLPDVGLRLEAAGIEGLTDGQAQALRLRAVAHRGSAPRRQWVRLSTPRGIVELERLIA